MKKQLLPALAILAGLTFNAALAMPISDKRQPFQQIQVSHFSGISVTGGVNLILNYHPDQNSSVQKIGPGARGVHILVEQGTLRIKAPDGQWRSHLPQVIISLSKPLTSLTVKGIADVTGNALRSNQLSISVKGPGHIALSGQLNTRQIWQTGGGYLSLQGVRANDLTVKLSELATTRLQGTADLLTARLTNSSTLQAEKLKTKTIFVQTAHHAVARVFPINNLRAFARGQSEIFYYHSPKHITEDAQQSGNILQMGWRH